MTEIVVPSLGESVTEATISQWLKKEGESVKADEPLVELETDKVTLEVNAPSDGVIATISVKEGETVEVGTVLGEVTEGNAANDSEDEEKKSDASQSESKAAAGKMQEIVVPSLGESVTEAIIGKWLRKEGDSVEMDEPLVELETDKATMEINAPTTGALSSIDAKEGETVEVGAVIGQIAAGATAHRPTDGEGKGQPDKDSSNAPEAGSKNAGAYQSDEEGAKSAQHRLSPAVRKLVEDNALDAGDISGTGKDGRITKEDVQGYLAEQGDSRGAEHSDRTGRSSSSEAGDKGQQGDRSSSSSVATITTAAAEEKPREERVRMSKLRQSIARRLKEAQNTAAMLTTYNEVNMTAVMNIRARYKEFFEKKHGVKLGFMSFFVKAVVNALKEFPEINAEIDGNEIVYKNYYHISVAVSTPQGLVVPVLRDCDKKSMAGIEKEIMTLGAKARDGKLSIQEMMGGTYTITNGGVFGSLMSMPIINPPQSAILGMHKIQQRPVVMPDGSISAQPMMYLAMSYDHRIVDGKEAVSFLVAVKNAIEDPQRLILDL